MRLFTAIDLPAHIVANIDDLLQRLRPTARLKWSPPANLHITTRFIGDWPEPRLPELRAALASLPPRAPIPIAIRGLGFFPNPHSPRILWAGVHAPADLAALASAIDAALHPLGLPREDRTYSPHLTLARLKTPVPIEDLREAIAGLPSTDFGEFVAAGFHLYLSRPGPSGSVYTKLAEFPAASPDGAS